MFETLTRFCNRARALWQQDAGAVTVDWVVLTAAVIALVGLLGWPLLFGQIDTLQTAVGGELGGMATGVSVVSILD